MLSICCNAVVMWVTTQIYLTTLFSSEVSSIGVQNKLGLILIEY